MKRISLCAALMLLVSLWAGAQGVKAGPWLGDCSENAVTILWTSEVPGMAYVELEDGTQLYETFAGRRIFRSFHSI